MFSVRHASALSVSFSLGVLLTLGACRGSCGGGEKGPAPTSSSSATAEEAGASTKGPSEHADKGQLSKLSNLLYTTKSAVAVSSKVDNPKDFPEHLIDGKPETAWNGKTGDLSGWIAVRIPKEAHVAFVAMTTGFDKKDLFTQNHRIKRVKVTRDGKVLREATLDVGQRAPQKITIDADGGELRIDVLETEPGTKKEWKELTVSEFSVWGDPKTARLPATRIPRVTIGSFEAPKEKAVTPLPLADSFQKYCKEYNERETPVFLDAAGDFPGLIEGPYCSVGEPLIASPPAPFLDVKSITRTDLKARTTGVGIRTKKGIFFTDIAVALEDLRNPGCGGACSQKTKSVEMVTTPRGPALVTVIDEHCWTNPWPAAYPEVPGEEGSPGSSTYVRRAEVCTVDADGDVACTQHEVSKVETKYRAYEEDFERVPWDSPKRRRVLPNGELVFE